MSTPNQNIDFNNGIFSTDSFLDSLQYIPTAISGETEISQVLPSSVQSYYTSNSLSSAIPLSALVSDLGSSGGITASQAVTIIQDALQNNVTSGGVTLQPFTNLSGFMSSIGTAIQTVTGTAATTAQLQAAYDGLLTDFASLMDIQFEGSGTSAASSATNGETMASSSDWQVLANAGITVDFNYSDISSPNNQFVQVVNAFLAQYTYPAQDSSVSTTYSYISSFLNQFHQYLSGIATLQPESSTPFISLSNYQNYYMAMMPNATQAGFNSFMSTFYNQQVSSKGFFLPSQSFGAFVEQVNADSAPSFGNSSIAGTDSSKAMVLNRIMALLVGIINALQNVGIAQANNLTFLTNYQNAYTALLQEIPTYLADNKTVIGVAESANGGSQATTDRNDINSSLNGVYADNLRSLQNVQSNQAKTVQSNINTTNDAVNQQTDMATTFLQQMSQLLGVIFK